jgi:protein-S-isoprenylcysteine O-methyltransferase Ste14
VAYILVGSLAFVIAFFFDLAALKGIRYLKQIIGVAFVLLFGYAMYGVCFATEKLALPACAAWAGWPLAVISGGLLVYSLFLEIPFKATYAHSGTGQGLVTTGTYALTRHPGVLWFGLFLLGLTAISHSKLFLVAAPVWFALDVLYVWIQDRFYFPVTFAGYEQYKRETPMLVPTRDSIVRCVRTLRKG